MRRILAAILGCVVAASPTTITEARNEPALSTYDQEMTGTYRIVHTGDSISAMSWSFRAPGGYVVRDGREYRNLEHGRNAYTAGMANRASHASIWPLLRSRSRPGGFIVFQDNGLGVSDTGWLKLLQRIVAETPHDRTLVAVLPGYLTKAQNPKYGNDAHAALVAERATVLGQVFMTHPNRRFVFLNDYMDDKPWQFPDGQHPNFWAARWIRLEITAWTG